MTAPTLPGYMAEVYAEWPIGRGYVNAGTRLSVRQHNSPRLAVRWLRDAARHLADHIDPAPGSLRAIGPPRAFRPVPPSGPNTAVHLRSWADSERAATLALEALETRAPFRAAFPEDGFTFVLSIWLCTVSAEGPPAEATAQCVGTLAAPLYADAH
ncbi:hypothetical protein ACIQHY_21205 [Streptomyces sp. NPDC092359]|uniref:hypothetical protein n=1 Tax=Streptomyces sp. NPDC092359 TaxID=3366014 RepID=UPI003802D430